MKNEIVMNLRAFPVKVHDHRDGQEKEVSVTVSAEQLRAVGVVRLGQTSSEIRQVLIESLCEEQGYTVLEIGKPVKFPVTVDLGELAEQYVREQGDKRASVEASDCAG